MSSRAMRTISVRTLLAHKVRLLLTILSVVLGTAFIAGSAMFTSSLSQSFDNIIATQFDRVDIAVTGELTPEVIDRLRAADGVAQVEIASRGANVIVAGPDKKVISSGGAPSQALAIAPGTSEISTQGRVVQGHLPTAPGEVALNEQAAVKGHAGLGDEITIVTPQSRVTRTLVGTFEAGTSTGGWIGVAFPEDAYRELFPLIDSASVSLVDHDAVDAATTALAEQFPELKVQAGKTLAEDYSKLVRQILSFVNYFLWAFAGIALLVGTFIISNTFSMIVAQRNREFALLRAIGTSSQQISRAVVFEAVLVGLVGSGLGVLAGMGLVKLLSGLLSLMGVGLPAGGFGLTPTSVASPLVIGTVVTVLSAWAPARRAGAIRPVQALRTDTAGGLGPRTMVGAVFLFAGALACVLGGDMAGAAKPRAIGVGIGALLLIVGLWLAGPALSVPVVGVLGRVAGKPFRAVGRLAATNSDRNPRRTAATAFALTLGLIMVSSIGMLGATMKASLDDVLESGLRADYVLTGRQDMGISIPAGVDERIHSIDGVARQATIVTVTQGHTAAMPGGFGTIGYTGDLTGTLDIDFTRGGPSIDGHPGVLVSETFAAAHNLTPGAGVEIPLGDDTTTAPVAGVYADNPILGDGVVPKDTLDAHVHPGQITTRYILVGTDNANKKALRTALEDAVADDLVVTVKDKEEFKGEQTAAIGQMLGILYGLLGLAVIVAILGIVNTLALSVVERRQEIGMLRAVGMQRRQIRLMIYIESAVIAVFGALTGALVGLGVGYSFVSALSQDGLDTIVIPWGQVGSMLIASAVIGILAAVLPALKAARTAPLEAIAE
ncbi:ABC transporter permease [Corynebacterium sp. 13CS0277]|uniref:ABC transporter permease n=1 Tax=Corynebacterium sp. 13CS0277 TaxID=2071994 RepID=UPI000D0378C4|nr:FtsX-like permease family protein [Corynebacterium sp. 13CS0277]PRQ10458.1 ABC transporter permease [Corynebacterium sp. 13CS0277]